jgi:predicted O-methyltransferase YrrM
MNTKTPKVLAAALLAACLGVIALTHCSRERAAPPPAQPAAAPQALKETTLRNITDSTIAYKIFPVGRPQDVDEREIVPGAIDRFPTPTALEIEFRSGDKDIVYSLDAGSPYSFRYDQGETIELFLGSHGRADAEDLAPWVATPQNVVDRMLELARVTAKDIVYDIGCGDGRIVVTAARRYGARGVGIDIDPNMIDESNKNAEAAGVAQLVRFVAMDATKADFSEATVVTLYLLPESNDLLRPIFERQLKPGTRIVSHNYTIPGWEAKQIHDETIPDEFGEEHRIYGYIR